MLANTDVAVWAASSSAAWPGGAAAGAFASTGPAAAMPAPIDCGPRLLVAVHGGDMGGAAAPGMDEAVASSGAIGATLTA